MRFAASIDPPLRQYLERLARDRKLPIAEINRRIGERADAPGPLPCGLPQTAPLWVDYADGMVPFWSTIFARPGIVGAASNFIVPPQLRAKGAKTVYFDLYLNNRVGTPSKPADPTTIQGRADKLFDTAASSSGCATPLVALNELSGANLPT